MDSVVAGSQLAVEPPPEMAAYIGDEFVPQVRVTRRHCCGLIMSITSAQFARTLGHLRMSDIRKAPEPPALPASSRSVSRPILITISTRPTMRMAACFRRSQVSMMRTSSRMCPTPNSTQRDFPLGVRGRRAANGERRQRSGSCGLPPREGRAL